MPAGLLRLRKPSVVIRKKEEGRRKKEEARRQRSSVRHLTERRKQEKGR
ncbi:hypothetical protein QUA62_02340 [Microcoleus sp. MON1_C1]